MNEPAVEKGGIVSFVQSLASNLSSGTIEIPSFPKVVVRLRQILEDERSTTAQIAQLLAAEPALAARLLKISNSAALRPGTSPITDINMAINRLGCKMVRNSSMSYAFKKIRDAQTLEAAQSYLEEIWSESTHVAALCYVLAKKFTRLNPDEALLVGLLHGIGKLYILGQAESHPEFFQNEGDLRETLREWHGTIGSAILESWEFSDEVSSSIANYQELDRQHDGPTDLTDILIVAHLVAKFLTDEADSELQLDNVPASKHLDVSAENFITILQESEEHISSLRRALGA